MKISLKWLQQYLPSTISAKELEHILPNIGHEVDAIQTFGLPLLPNVVVGQILESNPHPSAERLSVCKVKVHPSEEPLQIVCGAKNYKVGDYVPIALEGACLPGNFKIQKSKLRGVDSFGMMCSPRELGLGNDQEGLFILQDPPPIGAPINQAFPDNDTILDIGLTANRGDCMSHLGIARELAAYYDTEVLQPKIQHPIPFEPSLQKNSPLKGLAVESPNCPLFTTSFIKGIKIAPSPAWLQKALQSVGMRSINNVVDITNWVMLETGQPLHAFDLAKIKGHNLVVRQAKPNEVITTLDNKKRTLQPFITVIADSERPLVIAGIMGSIDAEVDNSTIDIVLESASFKPSAIRHTARALGLNTDSAQRFMRDVDPQAIFYAANRAIDLILQIAGGEVITPSTAIGKPHREPQTITLDPSYIQKVCGFPVPEASIENIFRRLNFTIQKNHQHWSVTIPTYRAEVHRPIDLVEEFLRIYGTDKIPDSPVTLKGLHRTDHPIAAFNQRSTCYLASHHFNECYHYSLRSQNELQTLFDNDLLATCALANPLTSDYSHLRPSLLPGLFDAFRLNQNNGASPERLFEVGRVFRNLNNQTYERPLYKSLEREECKESRSTNTERTHVREVLSTGMTQQSSAQVELHSGLCEVLSVAFIIAQEPTQRHWLKRTEVDFFKIKSLLLQIADFAGINTNTLLFSGITESKLFQNNHAASAGNLAKDNFQLNCGLADLKLTKHWGITPPLLCAEIFILPTLLSSPPTLHRFQPFSHFPTSSKDIAMIIDNALPTETVRQTLLKLAHKAVGDAFSVETISIFDVYQGSELPPHKKSLAFSLTFRASDRTLTDEEVMNAFNQLRSLIKESTDFEIRTT